MPRIFLMLLLLAAAWPAGWSGGGMLEEANPNYDRFFKTTDATNLNNLGVNLLLRIPSHPRPKAF